MQSLHQSQPGHWCFPTLHKVYLKSVIALWAFSLICCQWQAIDITVGLGLQQSMENCSEKRNKNVELIQILPCMSRMNRCGTCSNTHRVRVCDARDFWCACVMQRYIQVVLYTILSCNWTTDLLIITWCWRGEGDSLVCLKWVYVPSRVSFLRSWVLKQGVKSPISLLILLYGRFRKWSCYLGICYHPLRQIIPLTH